MPKIRTTVPRFCGTETPQMQIEMILQYLNSLQEELKYLLGHLNAGNINGAGFSLVLRGVGSGGDFGTMGVIGEGVGLSSGAASVTACRGVAGMSAGNCALRVTADGIQATVDDGKTWMPLMEVTSE